MSSLASPPAMSDREFCESMLPRVSRSFALSIRLLPRRLERSVGLAYLVCRVADTVEDDATIATTRRRELLACWRLALSTPDPIAISFAETGQTAQERVLSAGADRIHREFWRLEADEREVITRWAAEMIDGMSEFLEGAPRGPEPMFESMKELERYCYYVAGTVGHMLTALFAQTISGIREPRRERLDQLATNFGLSLQLTNVIRDVEADHRDGRNLVPLSLWTRAQIEPPQFFGAGLTDRSWAVMTPLLDRADETLLDALHYACTLPRTAVRIRLFCFGQLFFARRTLSMIHARREVGKSGTKVKMPRSEIYGVLALTLLCIPFNGMLSVLFDRMGHTTRAKSLAPAALSIPG